MQQSIIYIQTELKDLYPENEIRSFTNLLLEEISGCNRMELIINKNTIFSDEQVLLLQSFVGKLKKHTPIQYILAQTEFYGLHFFLNSDVLIPRPETEELVEWIQNSFEKDKKYSILDIGTGSGCIALSLKSIFSNAQISAIDISKSALEVANKNGKKLNLDVDFYQHDILNKELNVRNLDLIVSNPPYIPNKEKTDILANVLNYEPHLALFVDDSDPLLFYRTIANQAKMALKKGGHLFFETHRNFAVDCVEILKKYGFSNVELRKDLSGNDRMIKAKL